jgi:hypothetical protein
MSTQYHSKEQHSAEHSKKQQFSENSKEFSKTHEGKTDVTIEKVVNPPVVQEHHHHHTHTIIHPEVVREHNTTEIRQVVKPIHEHIKSAEKEEYAGTEVKVVEKTENTAEALRKREANQREIKAKADLTHTEDKTSSVDATKVRDVHAKHKVIEEVTPVIIRDVEHNKTIHKDEKQVEKIHHAPEVHKEELDVQHKEGYTKDTYGTTKGTTGIKEGYTRDTTTKGTTTGMAKGTTTGHKEGYTKETMTKGTTGLKEEQMKDNRIRKGIE